MSRAFGWVPDPAAKFVLTHVSEMGLLRRSEPCWSTSWIKDGHIREWLYQERSPSCALQSWAQAIRTRMSIAEAQSHHGVLQASPPLPSRRWLHRISRDTHEPEVRENGGTYLSSTSLVCRTLGWPSEKHASALGYAWDPDTCDDPVDGRLRAAAHDQRHTVEEYSIPYGDERNDWICRAAHSGHPMIGGFWVGNSYADCNSFDPITLRDGTPGVNGHANMLLDVMSDGVVMVNWWPDWGAGGVCLLPWSETDELRDLRAISVALRSTS